jgi:hypothetical protein
MRTISALALALTLALLSGCGDSDEAPTRATIDVARASGKQAKATAEGIADRPVAIAVRASAAPKQRVTITWGLSCPKTANGKDKGTGGSYVTTPPNVRALTLPKRVIAFCAVRAEGQLRGRGRVKVTLLASKGGSAG